MGGDCKSYLSHNYGEIDTDHISATYYAITPDTSVVKSEQADVLVVTFSHNDKLINKKDYFTLDEDHEEQKFVLMLYIAPFVDTYDLKSYNTTFVNDVIEYQFRTSDKQIMITYKIFLHENLMTREFKKYNGY